MTVGARVADFGHGLPHRVHRRPRAVPGRRPRRTWRPTRSSRPSSRRSPRRLAQTPRAAATRRTAWWAVARDDRGPGRRGRDADGAVRAVPALRAADAGRRRAWRSPGRCTSAARRSAGSTARCRRRGWWPRSTARLAGGEVSVHEHTPALRARRPGRAAGAARAAAAGHPRRRRPLPGLVPWTSRTRPPSRPAAPSRTPWRSSRWTRCSARIDDGIVWLWEDEAGEVVHLTGANLPGERRHPDRPGLHAARPARPRLRQPRRRRGLAAATSSRACAAASSPTRPTRSPTTSTRRSATARWSTW